jgi:hypothetical protein
LRANPNKFFILTNVAGGRNSRKYKYFQRKFTIQKKNMKTARGQERAQMLLTMAKA